MVLPILSEPIRDAIVWDSSSRFSARTFIRMMTRGMQTYLQTVCQQPGKGRNLKSSFKNEGLDEAEGRVKRFIHPQYSVEPQKIEGPFEGSQILI